MSTNLGSFSYIERDYQDILSAIVQKIPNITPEWSDWNNSDIGITILNLLSGIAEMLAYTEDQHANQLTIPTCNQRESMINLTKSLAYTMSNVTAASVNLIFSRTPYTTTILSTTLANTVLANTSTIIVPTTGFVENDVLYLDTGSVNEYVIVNSSVEFGGSSTITIKGVTRYAYSIGDSVGKISKNKNVIIPDNLKCITTGVYPIYFETDAESINYTIYAGSTYPDQAIILDFNSTDNTITVSNAFDYASEEELYLKSSIFTNDYSLSISSISGRVITLSDTLPNWIATGDTIARMVPATQGITKSESLAVSTGLPTQYRDLTYTPVINDSIVVEVNEGSAYETWIKVDSFLSSDSNDKHYTLQILADDKGRVTFGDGTNGKIPLLNSNIRATYTQGGGTEGNTGKNTINKVSGSVSDVGGSTVSLTVNNQESSSGGADKESLNLARVRAPSLYASTYRALSTSDFEALAKGYRSSIYGTIANAKVIEALVDNSVSVYVWASDTDGFATSASSGLKLALKDYLLERAAVGYLVSVVDGYTTSIDITATVYVTDSSVQSEVRANVLIAINNLFQIEDLTPSDDFYLSNLYEAIENVSGVDRVDITNPVRPGVPISNLHVPIKGIVNLTMVGGE